MINVGRLSICICMSVCIHAQSLSFPLCIYMYVLGYMYSFIRILDYLLMHVNPYSPFLLMRLKKKLCYIHTNDMCTSILVT